MKEDYTLDKDIYTFYVEAAAFPQGVAKAHEDLHALLSSTTNRKFYGISRPNKEGVIIYFAAVEESFEGEAEKYGCKKLVLKKGDYVSILIHDYKKDIESISAAFMMLLKDPRLDPQGYCVEMYLGEKDVRCMVRLRN